MEYLAPTNLVFLFIGMLICLELGRRIGLKSPSVDDPGSAGKKVVEAAFFGLFSLLVAFAFSGAVGRFDHRRALVVEEANDIGTAYLRTELLDQADQPKMRDMFRAYLDSRLATYAKLPDVAAARQELLRTEELQREIWTAAVETTRSPNAHPDAGKLLLPALNSMIDITNTRTWAALTHPPTMVYAMLFVVALICSFLAGNSLAPSKPSPWGHMLAFALLFCVCLFLILEIEYPRMGFADIEKYDRTLIDLRESMK